jgi:hypothetical protein
VAGYLPCVVHIKVVGAVEYLGEDGEVTETVTTATQHAVYLAWCRERNIYRDGRPLKAPADAEG